MQTPRTIEALERAAQIEHARQLAASEAAGTAMRRTLTVSNPGNERRVAAHTAHDGVERRKTGGPLAGHEAFIASLRKSNADIVLEKVSSGDIYFGKFRHSDKWSVTLYVTAVQHGAEGNRIDVTPHERVIFKHDISEFYTTTPRPAEGQRA